VHLATAFNTLDCHSSKTASNINDKARQIDSSQVLATQGICGQSEASAIPRQKLSNSLTSLIRSHPHLSHALLPLCS
jgi:hypothetical protein